MKIISFNQVWLAQTVSTLGTKITNFSLVILAINVLRVKPFDLGIINMSTTIPILALGLFVGVFVDRYSKRWLMVTTDLIRAILACMIAFFFSQGNYSFGWLCLAGLFGSSCDFIFEVARQALIPVLLKDKSLIVGNSKFLFTTSICITLASGTSGFLIEKIGAANTFWIDAFSFFVSACLVAFGKEPVIEDRKKHTSPLSDLKEGLSFVFSSTKILWLMILGMIWSLSFAMASVMVVLFAETYRGLSVAHISAAFAVAGTGNLMSSFLIPKICKNFGYSWSLIVGSGIATFGSLLISVPNYENMYIFCGAFFLLNFGASIFGVSQMTLRQSLVPELLQGRVSATASFIFRTFTPLGGLLGGIVGSSYSPRSAMIAGGLGYSSVFLISILFNFFQEKAASETEFSKVI